MVGHDVQRSVSYISRAMNFDIVGRVTLKCLSQPAGFRKHGCYGKSISRASD